MSRSHTLLKFPVELLESKADTAFGDHTKDVIHTRFKLVYEGVNGNGDYFSAEELSKNYMSLLEKPITWEHDEPNIGTITKATLVTGSNEPTHVVCEATIWAYRYPEYADHIISAAQLSEVGLPDAAEYAMSMEVYFSDADYVIGDWERVIPRSQDTGELEMLKGRTVGGKLVFRVLKDITFGGAGVTPSPAEKKARFLAVASNKKSTTGVQLFPDLSDEDFAMPSKRLFPINSAERTEASLTYFSSIAEVFEEDIDETVFLDAHDKLLESAEDNGLSTEDHKEHCSFCKSVAFKRPLDEAGALLRRTREGSTSVLDTSKVKEESGMADKETKVLDAEATEVPVEEAVVEEVVAEELTEGISLAEGFDFRGAFTELKELITSMTPKAEVVAETEATDEGAVEEDELTVANKAIEALKSELETSKNETKAAEAKLTGQLRLTDLVNAGVVVEKAAAEKKREFLASLDESAWGIYLSDIKSAKASVEDETEEDEPGEAVASLILESDDTITKYDKAKKFWGSSTVASINKSNKATI